MNRIKKFLEILYKIVGNLMVVKKTKLKEDRLNKFCLVLLLCLRAFLSTLITLFLIVLTVFLLNSVNDDLVLTMHELENIIYLTIVLLICSYCWDLFKYFNKR